MNCKTKELERKIYEMLKAGWTQERLKDYEKTHAPKVLIENEKRKLMKFNLFALEAYNEYKNICKGNFYIKRINIDNKRDLDEWIYQVSFREEEESEYETDNNAMYGLLFDRESLAILYLYKYCNVPHPMFDEYIKNE